MADIDPWTIFEEKYEQPKKKTMKQALIEIKFGKSKNCPTDIYVWFTPSPTGGEWSTCAPWDRAT